MIIDEIRNDQELNEKLARWAGFNTGYMKGEGAYYCYPNSDEMYYGCINFTHSPDACLEHLAPKLLEEYNFESYWFIQHNGGKTAPSWYYSETNIWRKGSTKHNFEVLQDQHIAKAFEGGADLKEITALAFCRALEKVI